MKGALDFITFLDEALKVVSKKNKSDFSKEQELELSKRSKLPSKMEIDGYKVFSSTHAKARASQRRNDKSTKDWENFVGRVIDHLQSNGIKKGSFMFHSKSENQSVVCKIINKKIEIVTVFPKGTNGRMSKTQIEKGQKLALIESIGYDYDEVMREVFVVLGTDVDDILIFD